jgi:transcriptional regulator with XRE-family HTH domain
MLDAGELRKRRKALGWDREKMASRLMNISERALRSYENGERDIPDHKAERLEHTLSMAEQTLEDTGGRRSGPRYLIVPEPGEDSTIRRLKTRMQEKGITAYDVQEDLGDGFAVGTIYAWLRGESEPKATKWHRFCDYLDLADEAHEVDAASEREYSVGFRSDPIVSIPKHYDPTGKERIFLDREEAARVYGSRLNDLEAWTCPSNTLNGVIDKGTTVEGFPADVDDVKGSGIYLISHEGGDHPFAAELFRVAEDEIDVRLTAPVEQEYTVVREGESWQIKGRDTEIDFTVLYEAAAVRQTSMVLPE